MKLSEIFQIIKEEIENLIDPNLQISYIPQGYKHTILDEKDVDDDYACKC